MNDRHRAQHREVPVLGQGDLVAPAALRMLVFEIAHVAVPAPFEAALRAEDVRAASILLNEHAAIRTWFRLQHVQGVSQSL